MRTKQKILIACALAAGWASVFAGPFYKQPRGLFSTRPSESKSLQQIKRFGPVGLGFDLIQPAFTLRIANVEPGSPAAATGKLAAGQMVETINGEKLADIDPRIQLGNILAAAEANDGLVKLTIKGASEPVTVKIPVLGAYSKTWPLNCAKSDKIVRQVADYLAQPKSNKGLGNVGMLFLLSTGDENDLAIVREWARTTSVHRYPWHLGYGGVPLAECYLRTGDSEILDNIQEWVDSACSSMYLGGWMGRGGVSPTYGNGHLNAAGTHVVTFLLLAKECGANVPDDVLSEVLTHFYRYAGRGSNPYGDNRVEVGFVDNGKNGKLALAMAAAAALTPDGENSVYAGARDVCAMQSFYSTTFMLHGHTGGGIGELWRSAAMGLLYDKKPAQYRDFMDNRQWHYDLSRRFDGSFGILGGSGYDKEQWGVAYPLTYTIPRKTLRISGAPPSKFSKPYQLPKIPWGTEADNAFLTLEAVPDAAGDKQDLSGETLAKDSSMHFLHRFHGKEQPSDDEIRRYMHHADPNIRFVAANKALGVNSGYIGWRAAGGKVRKELVMEFLQHKDPRVRRAMWQALEKKSEVVDEAVFNLAIKAVKDPAEAWSVQDPALLVVGKTQADWIAPHVDAILPFLAHSDWWMQNAALSALTPVIGDERCYRKVLPAVGKLVRDNQRSALTRGLMPGMRANIKAASSEVQMLATKTLQETFTRFGGSKVAPHGQDVSATYQYHLEAVAASLADVPGGLDVLYDIARKRFPDEILPYKQFFLNADPNQFGPRLKEAIKPIIRDELIPEFVGRNRLKLHELAAAKVQSERAGGSRDPIDGLSELHARAGEAQYGWQMFMDLRNAEWAYHSFDPIAAEQVPYDQLITRYRPVTLPTGMEHWQATTFSAPGWMKGKSPFGNYQGKVPPHPITKCGSGCTGPGCFGATPVNTLWEKEVLLMRGRFNVPPLKEGYRYRLRVNDGNHVGSGGGHIVFINGKQLIETKQGNGRGSGGLPKGAYITEEFLEDFRSGTITVAVQTFIRYNDKYKVKPSSKTPQGKFSLHFEQQLLPPMGEDLVWKSAAVVPMLTTEWQANQDPERDDLDRDAGKFRWDGKFVDTPQLRGTWKVVAQVNDIDAFDPATKYRVHRPPFSAMTFADAGRTADPAWAWSGKTLMDLTRYQALQIASSKVGDQHYLFIEAGGFKANQKPEWRTPWLVLSKQ